jgi:O-antigen/teichoic acid export membrane protein
MKFQLEKKLSAGFLILLLSTAAGFLTNVLLGRILPEGVFGKFKFIQTIVVTLSSLLLFGQNVSIIRLLAKKSFSNYDWKKFLFRCLLLSALIGFPITYVVSGYYKLGNELLLIYMALISSIGVEYFHSVLRARGRYSYAMFLSGSFSLFFLLSMAMVYFFFKSINFDLLLYAFTLTWFCSFLLSFFSLRQEANGAEKVPAQIIKEGLWIFFITITYILMEQVNQFFIVKFLSYKELASWAIIMTVARGYDLVATTLMFVFMPMYSENIKRSLRKDIIKTIIAGLILFLFYALFGAVLLHVLFKGRYDQYKYLLLYFNMIGFCKILYSVPGAVIGSQHAPKNLKSFLIACTVILLFNISSNYFIIPIMGLAGSAAIAVISWIGRLGSAYIVVYKERKERKSLGARNDG